MYGHLVGSNTEFYNCLAPESSFHPFLTFQTNNIHLSKTVLFLVFLQVMFVFLMITYKFQDIHLMHLGQFLFKNAIFPGKFYSH